MRSRAAFIAKTSDTTNEPSTWKNPSYPAPTVTDPYRQKLRKVDRNANPSNPASPRAFRPDRPERRSSYTASDRTGQRASARYRHRPVSGAISRPGTCGPRPSGPTSMPRCCSRRLVAREGLPRALPCHPPGARRGFHLRPARPLQAGDRPQPLPAASRRSFKWALEEELIVASPMDRMKPPIVGRVAVADAERRSDPGPAAVCSEDRHVAGRRDEALIRVLLDSGARRAEIAAIRWTPEDLIRTTWISMRASYGFWARAGGSASS